jgi:Fe-S cluster assembly iron-binding protein IscA
MLTVTGDARRELKRILEDRRLGAGRCLRLAIPPAWSGPGDFGIVIDDEKSDDMSVTLRGVKILLLKQDLAPQLSTSILDYKETPHGQAFTLDVY